MTWVLQKRSTGTADSTIKHLCGSSPGLDPGSSTAEFENFSQARNLAFQIARDHNHGDWWCQFALLVDADMELIVTDPNAFSSLDANAATNPRSCPPDPTMHS
jgi:hypothetical protein